MQQNETRREASTLATTLFCPRVIIRMTPFPSLHLHNAFLLPFIGYLRRSRQRHPHLHVGSVALRRQIRSHAHRDIHFVATTPATAATTTACSSA